MELKIPLPTMSDGRMPKIRSFRWCKELHTVLQPLRNYKLTDNTLALYIHVAAGPEAVAEIVHPFNETTDFVKHFALKENDINENDFVCRIMMNIAHGLFADVIYFVHDDFLNGGEKAREKFARVIQHLEEHAVPQIAPEWVKKTLDILQSK